jgi:hypothetical protein
MGIKLRLHFMQRQGEKFTADERKALDRVARGESVPGVSFDPSSKRGLTPWMAARFAGWPEAEVERLRAQESQRPVAPPPDEG